MRIRGTRGGAYPGCGVAPGEEKDVPDDAGRALVAAGAAEEVTGPPPAPAGAAGPKADAADEPAGRRRKAGDDT